MCRLLGFLSCGGHEPLGYLVDSDRSLLKLASINKEQLQSDGWGIGWFAKNRVVVERGVGGAYQPSEESAFVSAAKVAQGPLVLGHLRRASNPMKLPEEKLHGLENTQPFQHGQNLFIHNGSIPFPLETKSHLGPYSKELKGVNDSEVFFYLLLKWIDREKDVVKGYQRAVNELSTVWEENGKPSSGPYSGLNAILATSAKEFWAFCQYRGEHGTSLARTEKPYYEMCYRQNGMEVVVASEPLDLDVRPWVPLKNGEYLNAKLDKDRVALRHGGIPQP